MINYGVVNACKCVWFIYTVNLYTWLYSDAMQNKTHNVTESCTKVMEGDDTEI